MDVRKKESARQNRTQRRLGQTRRKLTEAASALFSQKGIDATTIQDITDRADLGKGTFYRHFSTKEEVMLALIQNAVTRLVEHIRNPVPAPGNLEQALGALLRAHLDFFKENRQEFVLLFHGRLFIKLHRDDSSGLEQPFVDYLNELERVIRPFLASAIPAAKLRRLACALAGFASGFISFAMIGLKDAEVQNSFQPLAHLFVSGSVAFLKDSMDRVGTSPAA